MGCAGREGKNNGRKKGYVEVNDDVENETMKYLGEVWTAESKGMNGIV